MSQPVLKATEGGIELSVWVKPRASRSGVLGMREGRLEVALAAAPVDGEANAELIRTLASHFGIARRQVQLLAGQAGRTKRIRILGLDLAAARALIRG